MIGVHVSAGRPNTLALLNLEILMSATEKNIYDLNELEDMFAAIDSLTRATAVLAGTDQQLAAELVKLTNTLIDLSESGQSVGFHNDNQAEKETDMARPPEENGIEDLTYSPQNKSRATFLDDSDDDEVIVDVLTGEEIKK